MLASTPGWCAPTRDELERVDVAGARHWRCDHLVAQQVLDLRQRWRVGVRVADRGGSDAGLHPSLDAGGRLDYLRVTPRDRAAPGARGAARVARARIRGGSASGERECEDDERQATDVEARLKITLGCGDEPRTRLKNKLTAADGARAASRPRRRGHWSGPRGRVGAASVGLDDHQGVAVRVAEPEQRRDGAAIGLTSSSTSTPRALRSAWSASMSDVLSRSPSRRCRSACRAVAGRSRSWWSRPPGPPRPIGSRCRMERRALLEAERVDVELDRAVLVGDRNHDRADLVDAGLGAGHDILLGWVHVR